MYRVLFLLAFFVSCKTGNNKINNNASSRHEESLGETFSLEKLDSFTKIKDLDLIPEFKVFLLEFNTDSKFQVEHVFFPLRCTSLLSYEEEYYDTTFLNKDEYEFMQLLSPRSNIIEGVVNIGYSFIATDKVVVVLGVEDTGVRIEYYFKINNKNEWILFEITDKST